MLGAIACLTGSLRSVDCRSIEQSDTKSFQCSNHECIIAICFQFISSKPPVDLAVLCFELRLWLSFLKQIEFHTVDASRGQNAWASLFCRCSGRLASLGFQRYLLMTMSKLSAGFRAEGRADAQTYEIIFREVQGETVVCTVHANESIGRLTQRKCDLILVGQKRACSTLKRVYELKRLFAFCVFVCLLCFRDF